MVVKNGSISMPDIATRMREHLRQKEPVLTLFVVLLKGHIMPKNKED